MPSVIRGSDDFDSAFPETVIATGPFSDGDTITFSESIATWRKIKFTGLAAGIYWEKEFNVSDIITRRTGWLFAVPNSTASAATNISVSGVSATGATVGVVGVAFSHSVEDVRVFN